MLITAQKPALALRTNRPTLPASESSQTEVSSDSVTLSRGYGKNNQLLKTGIAGTAAGAGLAWMAHASTSQLSGLAANLAGATGGAVTGVAAGVVAGGLAGLALTKDRSGFGGLGEAMLGATVGGVGLGIAGAVYGFSSGLNPMIAVAGGLAGAAVGIALTK